MALSNRSAKIIDKGLRPRVKTIEDKVAEAKELVKNVPMDVPSRKPKPATAPPWHR